MERRSFTVDVRTYDGKPITISGFRMPNPGKQPVILWPGFTQNGHFYDVMPGEGSLAEYLCSNGFDVWIIHSRGTGESTGRKQSSCLDDFAAEDIPRVITHVAGETNLKPVYVGHSQGGNTALMSLMGAVKLADGSMSISLAEAQSRQQQLKGFVTLGSYLDFTFSKESSLREFVRTGIMIKVGRKQFCILRSSTLLKILHVLTFLPVPISLPLRQKLLASKALRILLFPLTLIFNAVAKMNFWEFLYHIPNASNEMRRSLLYKTFDGTYWAMLKQHHQAILNEKMLSLDGKVNFSEYYGSITLPTSVVVMEYDTLADPPEVKRVMFEKLSGKPKFFTEWKGQGHEDFAMNRQFFPQVLEAIQKVC
ncbi:MAG: alpha/beta fold hydrolase [bacterium]